MVDLLWPAYYQSVVLYPDGRTGSFWWRDVLSFSLSYCGITRRIPGDGSSLLWTYFWMVSYLLLSSPGYFLLPVTRKSPYLMCSGSWILLPCFSCLCRPKLLMSTRCCPLFFQGWLWTLSSVGGWPKGVYLGFRSLYAIKILSVHVWSTWHSFLFGKICKCCSLSKLKSVHVALFCGRSPNTGKWCFIAIGTIAVCGYLILCLKPFFTLRGVLLGLTFGRLQYQFYGVFGRNVTSYFLGYYAFFC